MSEVTIESILQEKRVFKPSAEFVSQAAIKNMTEYQKLYALAEQDPNLLQDIQKIVDCNSQTDPSFKTQRLYTRLSAKQVKEELMSQFNYNEQKLPSCETIRQKLNKLGYYPQRVAKTQPQKKLPKQMISLNNCLNSVN